MARLTPKNAGGSSLQEIPVQEETFLGCADGAGAQDEESDLSRSEIRSGDLSSAKSGAPATEGEGGRPGT
jgi:hypothetical protein